MMNKFLLLSLISLFLAQLALAAAPIERTHHDYHELTESNTTRHTYGEIPKYENTAEGRKKYAAFLKEHLGVEEKEIVWGEKHPVIIRGSAKEKFTPTEEQIRNAELDPETYDVLIPGAGPAGLTAAAKLAASGKKILLLDPNEQLGGLAVGHTRNGQQVGHGGAYATAPEGKTKEVYDFIGLADFEKYAIPGQIDSFRIDGQYFPGAWENHDNLKNGPPSLAAFEYMLKHNEKKGVILSTPFPNSGKKLKELDGKLFGDWINSIPAELKKLANKGDKEAKEILERMHKDPRINKKKPMDLVTKILNLYGRSALGAHANEVNAATFSSFYISELGTRYSSNLGAGLVSEGAIRKIAEYPEYGFAQLGSRVVRVENTPDGVEVTYVIGDKVKKVRGKKAVMAAPMKVAASTIKDYEKIAPDSYKFAKGLEYRDYMVVNVHTKGHPMDKDSGINTYDLWTHDSKTYSEHESLTDIIDGRWMDYAQNPDAPRLDDRGVATIYKGESKKNSQGYPKQERIVKESERLTADAMKILADTQKQIKGEAGIFPVVAVEANYYTDAIHLTKKDHMEKAVVLQKPIGNILLANNNMGPPAVEEAAYRGYDAAERILKQLEKEAKAGKKTKGSGLVKAKVKSRKSGTDRPAVDVPREDRNTDEPAARLEAPEAAEADQPVDSNSAVLEQ